MKEDGKRVYSCGSGTTMKEPYRNHARDVNHDHYSKFLEPIIYDWRLK